MNIFITSGPGLKGNAYLYIALKDTPYNILKKVRRCFVI